MRALICADLAPQLSLLWANVYKQRDEREARIPGTNRSVWQR